jgi:hypothetical protein
VPDSRTKGIENASQVLPLQSMNAPVSKGQSQGLNTQGVGNRQQGCLGILLNRVEVLL